MIINWDELMKGYGKKEGDTISISRVNKIEIKEGEEMDLKQHGPESWMTWSEFCKGVRDTGKPQWISVKDRLPSRCRWVLLTDGDNISIGKIEPLPGGISLESYSISPIRWISNGFEGEDEVTHWMPLPELPSQK